MSTVPAIGLAGCLGGGGGDGDGDGGTSPTATSADETVRAAWVYISEVGDLGWSWAHDQGRKAVANRYDWLETSFSESVFPADGKQVMDQYTQQGFDIIFGTTFEYMDPMLELAKANPETLYEHCSGFKTHDNMGNYFGRMYQARYLAGMAAGMMPDVSTMGYVAAFPIPEVVRGINAFTAGARSVDDSITTKVRWTNTWFDPPTEKEAAQSLVDAGVDVMAQHQDSPAAVRAAAEAGIWATGYDAPMQEFGGESYITSPIWNWEVFYEPTLLAVKDGSWESDAYWEGLDAGVVGLSDWGPQVGSDVQDAVDDAEEQILTGQLDPWAGTKFEGKDDGFLFGQMSSYVEGVEGSVPS
ncbi:MAG: BMP family ABC transporter substrate-binding protein [Halobacteriales archaeon]|nr:BMP family ABC transporter substrate-binding protein [Halobacteriales archaeon]